MLYLEHMGPPRAGPKKRQKPEYPSGEVPELTFNVPGRLSARLCGVLVENGTSMGGVMKSFLDCFG